MNENSKEQAQELLEVLMNSKHHNPALALQEVLVKLREQLTLPRGVSVWEDEKGMCYDAGRDECIKEISAIVDELELL
jgi:ubiquitin-protein ligase